MRRRKVCQLERAGWGGSGGVKGRREEAGHCKNGCNRRKSPTPLPCVEAQTSAGGLVAFSRMCFGEGGVT
eukprot:3658808-Rhodomonas_salina.1